MAGLRSVLARLAALTRRRQLDQDLDDEMRLHLDLLTEEFERRGLNPAAARAAARREFGGLDSTRQAVRDRRGFRVADAIAQDTRLAARLVRKSPGFTAAIVLLLALGIGANSAIFSLIDAVLLQPLPYADADRLVRVYETVPDQPAPGSRDDAPPEGARRRIAVAPANLADYAARAGTDATLAYYSRTARTLTEAGTPDRLPTEEVSAAYLRVLGAAPALGRDFRPGDFAVGAPPVVLLAHAVWRDRLGAAPDAIGTTIRLDDVPHEVVGVLPEAFVAVSSLGAAEDVAMLVPMVLPDDILTGRGEHIVQAIGRMAPSTNLDALDAVVQATAAAIALAEPLAEDLGAGVEPLAADEAEAARALLLVLLAGVVVVLLAACANVAGLLVVRAIGREREVAVRIALGASRRRVLLEHVIYSLMLAAIGGGSGLALGYWLTQILVSQAPASLASVGDVSISWRTLAFTGSVATATALLFGALPAWHVSRARPGDVLQAGGRTMTGGWARRSRAALLALEVALSMLLLVGAGLMGRSLWQLSAVDLGFDPSNVTAVNLALPIERYPTPESRLQFFESVASGLEARPDVERVMFGNRLPLRGSWESGFELESVGKLEEPQVAGFQAVSAGYFDTLRIPLVAGRSFTAGDREGALPVAIVSEAFAREFLDGAPALGQRIRRFEGAPWAEIVGVARDLRRGGRTDPPAPQVYLPAAQTSLYPLRLSDLAVRTTVDTATLAPAIRAAVWAVDPQQPLTNLRSLDDTLALQQADVTFRAMLFGLFAALALTLAVVGIYGIVVFAVSERRTEISLRMALGASTNRVMRWSAGEAAVPVAAGSATGAVLAWTLSRHVESSLFGVTAGDPLTYAAAAMLLAAIGTAASLIAARQAADVEPADALK